MAKTSTNSFGTKIHEMKGGNIAVEEIRGESYIEPSLGRGLLDKNGCLIAGPCGGFLSHPPAKAVIDETVRIAAECNRPVIRLTALDESELDQQYADFPEVRNEWREAIKYLAQLGYSPTN